MPARSRRSPSSVASRTTIFDCMPSRQRLSSSRKLSSRVNIANRSIASLPTPLANSTWPFVLDTAWPNGRLSSLHFAATATVANVALVGTGEVLAVSTTFVLFADMAEETWLLLFSRSFSLNKLRALLRLGFRRSSCDA